MSTPLTLTLPSEAPSRLDERTALIRREFQKILTRIADSEEPLSKNETCCLAFWLGAADGVLSTLEDLVRGVE